MSNGTAHESLPEDAHIDAAKAFVDHARSRHSDELAERFGFGSTVRGEAYGQE